jgi:16S rRNA C967 or C1407 C5-methylase (RsmB/RsmF family)
MCAAPGIKTTQIAAHMGNEGAIVAVDIDRSRLYALENSVQRCGVENCVVYHSDVNELEFGEVRFDKVLLDAPCSGNHVIDEDLFSKRSLEDVKRNAERQRALLDTTVRLLKVGGVLVYTTCSLKPEEDELTIQWLLDNSDVKLEGIEGPGSPGLTARADEEKLLRINNKRFTVGYDLIELFFRRDSLVYAGRLWGRTGRCSTRAPYFSRS